MEACPDSALPIKAAFVGGGLSCACGALRPWRHCPSLLLLLKRLQGPWSDAVLPTVEPVGFQRLVPDPAPHSLRGAVEQRSDFGHRQVCAATGRWRSIFGEPATYQGYGQDDGGRIRERIGDQTKPLLKGHAKPSLSRHQRSLAREANREWSQESVTITKMQWKQKVPQCVTRCGAFAYTCARQDSNL